MKNQTKAVARTSKPSPVQVAETGYTFNGDLGQQIQAQAAHLGKSPDEIVTQALEEFVAKNGPKEITPIELSPDISRWLGSHAKRIGKTPNDVIVGALQRARAENITAADLDEHGELVADFRGDDGSREELAFDKRTGFWFLLVNGAVRHLSLADALHWYITRNRLHEHGGDFTWYEEIEELLSDIHRELTDFEQFRPQLEAQREARKRETWEKWRRENSEAVERAEQMKVA